ncbi:hypothetical protein C0Q70_01511 [Pomacea canaliculata]|uniref:Uncharacterized protein n=1 Tax=Pomacea canaliculata TaxID=400727 RepID=A0A2T7PZN3_POMCA|nr:hypothetical protein C0Q70_01511 [Pomacea canaliculata]
MTRTRERQSKVCDVTCRGRQHTHVPLFTITDSVSTQRPLLSLQPSIQPPSPSQSYSHPQPPSHPPTRPHPPSLTQLQKSSLIVRDFHCVSAAGARRLQGYSAPAFRVNEISAGEPPPPPSPPPPPPPPHS